MLDKHNQVTQATIREPMIYPATKSSRGCGEYTKNDI